LAFVSLYRKYRSQTFSDLIGQNHVVKTLQNGISSGRIAHAYLFTGPRGTGKTSTARLLAKALCCEKGPIPEPCNECAICKSISDGSCVDIYEMDAASEAGVEDVRDKIVNVTEYRPMVARYKVFIIDEVHDLSGKAFDALLKTIEEPPEYIIFVLATTEFSKVPPTIRSRCQKHEFHRASLTDLTNRLAYVAKCEGVDIEAPALTAIARMADGGYRDALTVLEQVILTADGKITVSQIYDQLGLVADEVVDRILIAIREGNVPEIAKMLNEISRLGRDPRMILESMLYRLADMTRVAYNIDLGGTVDPAGDAALHETSTRLGKSNLLAIRSELSQAHKVIRDITLPRLWLESELIRISQMLQTAPKAAAIQSAPAKPASQTQSPQASAPSPVRPESEVESVPEAPKTPSPSGDPELDEANRIWVEVKKVLGEQSKSMRMRLEQSRVVAVKGLRVEVHFERTMDIDWVKESPKRQAAILETARKCAGKEWKIEYCTAQKQNTDNGDAQTVELMAEGPRLVQTIRDVFGSGESK